MGKVFPIAIGVVVIIFLALMLPSITKGTDSFRTDVKTQSYTVTTAGGVTTANVTLSHELWNSAVTEVTNLSSNTTADNLVASTYTASGNLLTITGLAASTTRTVSVSYRTAGLDSYQGADQAATKFPTVAIGMIILIPLAILAAMFIKR